MTTGVADRDTGGLQADRYAIRVKGHLAPRWSEWFEGMTITHTEDGDTVLAGPVTDQAALHGLLARVRDLNLTLISVPRMDQPSGGKDEGSN